MSNFLAIATVTAALRRVLLDAVSVDVPGADVQVTHVLPGGTAPATPDTGVNLFLYAVTPNAALRNGDLPTRRRDGTTIQHAVAALDLHYLLTFHGQDGQLETQRLLGSVARTLHEQPTIPRAKLEEAIDNNTFLETSNLKDAAQPVRVTPEPLSLEELSRIWSILFQTPYALSAAYCASLVLIEGTDRPEPSLPVRRRNLYAVTLAQPFLEAVENASDPSEPIVSTSTLRLRGRNLRGDVTRVLVGPTEVPPATVSSTELTVPVSAVAGLRAGLHGARVVHRRLLGTPPSPHRDGDSNVVGFVLHPSIAKRSPDPSDPEHAVTFTPSPGPDDPPTVTVRVTPSVGRRQSAVLLVNSVGAVPVSASYESAPRTGELSELVFPVPGLASGTYVARVRIDGADSPLLQEQGVYARPRLVVP